MKTTLPNLQILRFLAAAMVLLSHVQHEAEKMTFGGAHYVPWNAIYLAGGVDIFFVISGFIMYAISSSAFGRDGAAGNFLVRRLIRIAPPYWLFTLAMLIATVIFADHITHSKLSLANVIASFFFIPHANAYGGAYPVLMLGWTLNYEFFFYMVFSLALCFRRTVGLGLVFGLIGAFAVVGMFDVLRQQPFMFWTNPIILEFLMGIALAMARERGMRVSPLVAVLAIVAGFALMFVLKAAGIATSYWTVRFLWMGLPALLICAGAVLVEQKPDSHGLKKALVFLGDSSYALYLSHPFSLNLVSVVWGRAGWQQPYAYVALSCVVSLVVGAAVHVLIEKPITNYLNDRLKARQKTRTLATH